MNLLLPLRTWLPALLLAGLAACSKDTPAPAGAIAGTMPPIAAVGHLLTVTATDSKKVEYQATADPATGAFAFTSLPPGTYRLSFSTSATRDFPHWVTVTVVAGATATPAIPPVTHDGVGRGTLRWLRDGQPCAATLIRVASDGTYFYLWGRSGDFGGPDEVREAELMLFQTHGTELVFNGVGSYPLGGIANTTAYGGSAYYLNNQPELRERYTTPNGYGYTGQPTGTAQLTRFDAEQGRATGTFSFMGYWSSGAVGYSLHNEVAVTDGVFDITF